MQEIKQRIAIAEACGWPYRGRNAQHLQEIGGKFWALTLPDYLNDLNAMHEAEKVLTDEQKREYRICLFRLCDCYAGREVHTTAAQRAEAFLKTLNLWTD